MKKYSLLKNLERLEKTYDEQFIKIPDWVWEHDNTGSSIGSGPRKKLETLFGKRGKIRDEDMDRMIEKQNLDVLEMFQLSGRKFTLDQTKKILAYENDFARGHNVKRTEKAENFLKKVVASSNTNHDGQLEEFIKNEAEEKQVDRFMQFSEVGRESVIMHIIEHGRLDSLSDASFGRVLQSMDYGSTLEALNRPLRDERVAAMINHLTPYSYRTLDETQVMQMNNLVNKVIDLGRSDALNLTLKKCGESLPEAAIEASYNHAIDNSHAEVAIRSIKNMTHQQISDIYLTGKEESYDLDPRTFVAAISALESGYPRDEEHEAVRRQSVEAISNYALGHEGRSKALVKKVFDGYCRDRVINQIPKEHISSFIDNALPKQDKFNRSRVLSNMMPFVSKREDFEKIFAKENFQEQKNFLSGTLIESLRRNEHVDSDLLDKIWSNIKDSPKMKFDNYADSWEARDINRITSEFIYSDKASPELLSDVYQNTKTNLASGSTVASRIHGDFTGLIRDIALNPNLTEADALDIHANYGAFNSLAMNRGIHASVGKLLAKHSDKDVRKNLYENPNLPSEIVSMGLKDRSPANKELALKHPNIQPEALHKFIMTPSKSKSAKGQEIDRNLKSVALSNPSTTTETIQAFVSKTSQLSEYDADALVQHPNATDEIKSFITDKFPTRKVLANAAMSATTHEDFDKYVGKLMAHPQYTVHYGENYEPVLPKLVDNPLFSESTGDAILANANEEVLDSFMWSRGGGVRYKFSKDQLFSLANRLIDEKTDVSQLDHYLEKVEKTLKFKGEEFTGDEKTAFVRSFAETSHNGPSAYRSKFAPVDMVSSKVDEIGSLSDMQEFLGKVKNENPEVIGKLTEKLNSLSDDDDPGSRWNMWSKSDAKRALLSRIKSPDALRKFYHDSGMSEHKDSEWEDADHYRKLADHMELPEDVLAHLHQEASRRGHRGVLDNTSKKIAVVSPDSYNASLKDGHSVDVHPAVEKLKHLKGLVEEMGGSIPKNKLQELKHGGAPGQILDHKGDVTANGIEKFLGTLPKTKYNVSYSNWKGMQRHDSSVDQKVVQVNLTDDHVKQLKEAGVFDVFRKIHESSRYSSHPVDYHSLGWARVDDSHHGHWHIDEIQSDFGQNTIRQIQKYRESGQMSEDEANKYTSGLKKIMDIIKGPFKSINHAIMGVVHQVARGNDVKSTSMDLIRDQMRQSGMSTERKPPGHMKQTYEQLPKQINYEPKDKTGAMPEHKSNETEVNYRKLTKSLENVKFLLKHLDRSSN